MKIKKQETIYISVQIRRLVLFIRYINEGVNATPSLVSSCAFTIFFAKLLFFYLIELLKNIFKAF